MYAKQIQEQKTKFVDPELEDEVSPQHASFERARLKASSSVWIMLLCITLGVIVSLIIVELGIRFMLSRSSVESWSDRPRQYYSHQSSTTKQDYPYSHAKPENTFRITVIGDSFTFGTALQFDDAFPKRLERMLNLNDGPLKAEVLNMGVPGFSTSHEVRTVREAIARGADLALLQITLNDPQIKPYRPTGLTRTNEFGVKSSDTRLGQYWKTFDFVATRIANTRTHSSYREYYFDLFDNNRTWTSFSKAINKISRLSNKKDVTLVAVVFPLFGLPLDENYPFHPLHQKVGKLLTEKQIPHLDLFETFRGIPLDRIQVIPGQDFHPNEIGHRMAAEAIYHWLLDGQFIPDQLRIRDLSALRVDIRK